MEKPLLAALLVLIVSPVTPAQDRSQSSAKAETAVARPAKSLTVSGRVGRDGRTLMTDLDSEWIVSNADALKGREGSLVTIKCYVDSDHTQIRVLSVRNIPPEPRFDPR